jgi:hypothetical protein
VPNRTEALRRVHTNFSDRYNMLGSITGLAGLGPAPLLFRQVEIVMVGLGVAVMALQAARAGLWSPSALVLAVLGGQVVITILGMRSEFDRYHVPMALLGAVGAAVALDWLTARLPRGLARFAWTDAKPRPASRR